MPKQRPSWIISWDDELAGNFEDVSDEDIDKDEIPLSIPDEKIALSDVLNENKTYTYIVVRGDSLWSIAQKQYGDGTRWYENI